MSVSLSKGGNVSLTKEAAKPLTTLTIGLGWDPQTREGAEFDLDASALIVANDKILSDKHFVFYNNPASPNSSVTHSGDNLTGGGAGDDEQIKVDVAKTFDGQADKVVFAVTIHEADERKQNFGQVRNAYIRVVDDNDGKELARYDLSEDYAGETAMIFGELYARNGETKFKAVGAGYNAGLRGIATDYGVNVA